MLLRAFLLTVLLTSQIVASQMVAPLGAEAELELNLEDEAQTVACICSLDAVGAGVCGADGNTYANECLAACAGIALVAPGACALHANATLFASPGTSAETTLIPTPLSAALINQYAAEGFRLVGRAEATAVVGRFTLPPEPTGAPLDPTARYAALRLDVATGLLYSSNGSSIAQAALPDEADLQTAESRPTRRPRPPRPQPAIDVASDAGTVAPTAVVEAQDATAAAAAVEPASVGVVPRSVFGADTRTLVTNFRSYPFTAVVALQGSTWCSGSMFNTHAVVTAAHCLYGESGWIDRSRLIVAPGAGRSCRTCAAQFPCGAVGVRHMTTYAAYTSTFSPAHDIAVIRLNRDIGACTGWFGMVANDGRFSGTLNTAGYPGDKPAYAMHFTAERVSDTRADSFLDHTLDTIPGQSGSPLWSFINNNRQIRAVHAYGVGNGVATNQGVAITNTDFTSINRWGA